MNTYMWNLEKISIYLQGKKRSAKAQTGDTGEKERCGELRPKH